MSSIEGCNMNNISARTLLLACFLVIFILSLTPIQAEQFKSTGTIDVYFSPNGGCTEAIVKELNNAKTEILVQAYSFTSKPIAKALVDAKKRNITGTITRRSVKHGSDYKLKNPHGAKMQTRTPSMKIIFSNRFGNYTQHSGRKAFCSLAAPGLIAWGSQGMSGIKTFGCSGLVTALSI
jgi:phosphatidylserine/phosphatidylglycerophosphate/cardiolipin synthase-like enzyme